VRSEKIRDKNLMRIVILIQSVNEARSGNVLKLARGSLNNVA